MIPKVIHYCWFGGNEKTSSVKRCIESWRKKCVGYEIKEWNENNFDIHCNKFVEAAYSAKKWAFVSDYARLWIVYTYGGVYLDVDVEVLKSFDELIESPSRGFFGFETIGIVATGVGFACEKGEPLLLEMMQEYEQMSFCLENLSEIKCPIINTKVLQRHGLTDKNEVQVVSGVIILTNEYLCPENFFTGEKNYTENTFSIHHYDASWMDTKSRLIIKLIRKGKSVLPLKFVKIIRRGVHFLVNK